VATLVALLVSSSLLAACGPGEPGIEGAPAVDACTLLRPGEVATLIGAPVAARESIPGTVAECRYRTVGSQGASLVLTWRPKELPSDERDAFEANRATVFAPHGVDVGDDAYVGGSCFGSTCVGRELHVLAGGDYLILVVPPRVPDARLVAFMDKVLSRRQHRAVLHISLLGSASIPGG
jgi:hypothetical protein